MSLEEYEDFVYHATNVDYVSLKSTIDKVVGLFNKEKKVRIVANQTDITNDIEGRKAQKGQEFLEQALHIDDGAKYLSE